MARPTKLESAGREINAAILHVAKRIQSEEEPLTAAKSLEILVNVHKSWQESGDQEPEQVQEIGFGESILRQLFQDQFPLENIVAKDKETKPVTSSSPAPPPLDSLTTKSVGETLNPSVSPVQIPLKESESEKGASNE